MERGVPRQAALRAVARRRAQAVIDASRGVDDALAARREGVLAARCVHITADRAGLQYHPRAFVPDGERGPPVMTDERMRRPVTGTRDYARRALPAPLVPSLKLRKRVFDRKITGRLGDDS